MKNPVKKNNIGFYEKLLPKCKKAKQSTKKKIPTKPQIACQPGSCYYLLFIAIGWVGREEFRAGQTGQDRPPSSLSMFGARPRPKGPLATKPRLRVWGADPVPRCPYKSHRLKVLVGPTGSCKGGTNQRSWKNRSYPQARTPAWGDNPRRGVSGKIRNKITARSMHLCHCSDGEQLFLTQ